MTSEPYFLVVDDDDPFRNRLVQALIARKFSVADAAHYNEACAVLEKVMPSHVILDLKMPGQSGLELIEVCKQKNPWVKIVILTGYGSIATALESVKRGACNYVTKPADLETILQSFNTPSLPRITTPSPPTLSSVEWEHIQRIMHDCHGNVTQAAKVLGIHRRSLQRKLKIPPQ